MQKTFEKKVTYLMEKHLPMGFIDYNFLQNLKKISKSKKEISRREILMLAYMIGARSKEADDLLEIKSYKKLYARDYEDAVWIFALDKQKDLTSVFDIIFSTKCEEVCSDDDI